MAGEWKSVGKLADLLDGEVGAVNVGERQIGLFMVEGTLYAMDNICSHAYACMSDGYLEEFMIECPLHAGRFDVRDGKAQGTPVTKDLEVFPSKVTDGEVFLQLP